MRRGYRVTTFRMPACIHETTRSGFCEAAARDKRYDEKQQNRVSMWRGRINKRLFQPRTFLAAGEPMNQYEPGRGIVFSVGASALFALLSAYARLLAPLTGLDIFAWRIIVTLPGAMLLILLRGRLPQLRQLAV
ncbi:MAG TPA: hypothetical protein VEI25_19785, partial [Paraburkholderia sp.]|nr:hypothetical protein [Paraburkholderia sp.]